MAVKQKRACRGARDTAKLKENKKTFWPDFQVRFGLIGNNQRKGKLREQFNGFADNYVTTSTDV